MTLGLAIFLSEFVNFLYRSVRGELVSFSLLNSCIDCFVVVMLAAIFLHVAARLNLPMLFVAPVPEMIHG